MKNEMALSLVLLTVCFFNGCKKEEPATLPVLATTAPAEITGTTAISGGIIISDGGAGISARGICWGIVVNPTISDTKTTDGDGKGQFVSNITGIDPVTLYHVRAYATNSVGTAYGADYSFSTLGQVPSATTFAATDITATSCTLNGTINANYAPTTVTFEYGLTTDYGSITSAAPSPVTGNTSTDVSADISNLKAGTTYHFRLKAVNSPGTVYGIDMSYTTILADGDGNVYNAVTIGTQVWLKENLKTTKYNDGTPIPNVTDNAIWITLTTAAYCWCANDAGYKNTYGALYNEYAVATDNPKNVCPTGWHVPSETDWTTLIDYLRNNGFGYLGKRGEIAKSMAATSGWPASETPGNIGNDQASNNSSGFSALPAGVRSYSGSFIYLFNTTFFWSSTAYFTNDAFSLCLNWDYNDVQKVFPYKLEGFSVRCLRDL
jgi:uncharacterized protein (TIGR02145 family)